VRDSLKNNAEYIQGAEARIKDLKAAFSKESLISTNISRIPDTFLLLMFRSVATFGLPRWMPDALSGDPDSMYNLLHEYIALVTFEQVANGFGYVHMGINLSFIRDFTLMRNLYRSFVFSYLQKLTKMETKEPGAVMKSHERENMIKRRTEVCIVLSISKYLLSLFLACSQSC